MARSLPPEVRAARNGVSELIELSESSSVPLRPLIEEANRALTDIEQALVFQNSHETERQVLGAAQKARDKIYEAVELIRSDGPSLVARVNSWLGGKGLKERLERIQNVLRGIPSRAEDGTVWLFQMLLDEEARVLYRFSKEKVAALCFVPRDEGEYQLWVAAGKSLWLFCRDNTQGSTEYKFRRRSQAVTCMAVDRTGHVWTGHSDGSVLIHKAGDMDDSSSIQCSPAMIKAIVVDEQGKCWAGDADGQLHFICHDRVTNKLGLACASVGGGVGDRASGSKWPGTGMQAAVETPIHCLFSRGQYVVVSGGRQQNQDKSSGHSKALLSLWHSGSVQPVRWHDCRAYGFCSTMAALEWDGGEASPQAALAASSVSSSSWRLITGHEYGNLLLWDVSTTYLQLLGEVVTHVSCLVRHIAVFEETGLIVVAHKDGHLTAMAKFTSKSMNLTTRRPPGTTTGAGQHTWTPKLYQCLGHRSGLVNVCHQDRTMITVGNSGQLRVWYGPELRSTAEKEQVVFPKPALSLPSPVPVLANTLDGAGNSGDLDSRQSLNHTSELRAPVAAPASSPGMMHDDIRPLGQGSPEEVVDCSRGSSISAEGAATLRTFGQIIPYKDIERVQVIGRGAEGTVWWGWWQHIKVAVKQLELDIEATPESRQASLEKEVEFLGRCMLHPNVVRLCGVCVEPPMVVTEYYSNGSLYQILQKAREGHAAVAKQLTWKLRLEMLSQIATGMIFLHFTSGCVHGDLRSPNIFVDQGWQAKIGDFGFAKKLGGAAAVPASKTTNPRWLAPEVAMNSNQSREADVYSFAIIMWEMLTWQKPFEDMKSVQVCYQVNQGARPDIPPDEELPGLNPGIVQAGLNNYKDLMCRCWSPDPQERPDFRIVAESLRSLSYWFSIGERHIRRRPVVHARRFISTLIADAQARQLSSEPGAGGVEFSSPSHTRIQGSEQSFSSDTTEDVNGSFSSITPQSSTCSVEPVGTAAAKWREASGHLLGFRSKSMNNVEPSIDAGLIQGAANQGVLAGQEGSQMPRRNGMLDPPGFQLWGNNPQPCLPGTSQTNGALDRDTRPSTEPNSDQPCSSSGPPSFNTFMTSPFAAIAAEVARLGLDPTHSADATLSRATSSVGLTSHVVNSSVELKVPPVSCTTSNGGSQGPLQGDPGQLWSPFGAVAGLAASLSTPKDSLGPSPFETAKISFTDTLGTSHTVSSSVSSTHGISGGELISTRFASVPQQLEPGVHGHRPWDADTIITSTWSPTGSENLQERSNSPVSRAYTAPGVLPGNGSPAPFTRSAGYIAAPSPTGPHQATGSPSATVNQYMAMQGIMGVQFPGATTSALHSGNTSSGAASGRLPAGTRVGFMGVPPSPNLGPGAQDGYGIARTGGQGSHDLGPRCQEAQGTSGAGPIQVAHGPRMIAPGVQVFQPSNGLGSSGPGGYGPGITAPGVEVNQGAHTSGPARQGVQGPKAGGLQVVQGSYESARVVQMGEGPWTYGQGVHTIQGTNEMGQLVQNAPRPQVGMSLGPQTQVPGGQVYPGPHGMGSGVVPGMTPGANVQSLSTGYGPAGYGPAGTGLVSNLGPRIGTYGQRGSTTQASLFDNVSSGMNRNMQAQMSSGQSFAINGQTSAGGPIMQGQPSQTLTVSGQMVRPAGYSTSQYSAAPRLQSPLNAAQYLNGASHSQTSQTRPVMWGSHEVNQGPRANGHGTNFVHPQAMVSPGMGRPQGYAGSISSEYPQGSAGMGSGLISLASSPVPAPPYSQTQALNGTSPWNNPMGQMSSVNGVIVNGVMTRTYGPPVVGSTVVGPRNDLVLTAPPSRVSDSSTPTKFLQALGFGGKGKKR